MAGTSDDQLEEKECGVDRRQKNQVRQSVGVCRCFSTLRSLRTWALRSL